MSIPTKHIVSSETSAAWTVADLVKHFIHRRTPTAPPEARAAVRSSAYGRQAQLLLMSNVLNRIGQTLIRNVTRLEVAELLDNIVRRGAPVTANRVYYLLRQCFRFAVAWDVMPRSPIEGMRLPGGRESPRFRVLTDAEIVIFWQRIESANMAAPTKLGLKLHLVEAQRPGDVIGARWLDFNLDKRVWTIPAAGSMGARPHTVPLSQLAIEILTALRCIIGNSGYVLASPRTLIRPRSPYSAGVLSHAVRRNELHWGIDPFTPYDLRRTAAAGMAAIDIPARHIAKVLNYSVGAHWAFEKIGRDFFQEKQTALNRWAAHLERLVGIVRADTASNEVEAYAPRPKARRLARSRPAARHKRRPRRRLPK